MQYLSFLLILIPLLAASRLDWQSGHRQQSCLVTAISLLGTALLCSNQVIYISFAIAAIVCCIVAFKGDYTPDDTHDIRTRQWMSMALVSYVVANAITLTWSHDKIRGLHYLIDLLPLLVAALTLRRTRLSEDDYAHILRTCYRAAQAFLILVVISILYSCHQLQMSLWDWPILEKEFIAYTEVWHYSFYCFKPYYHPTFQTLTSFILLMGGVHLWQKRKIQSWDYWLTCLAYIIIPLYSQSRIGLCTWITIPIMSCLIYFRDHARIRRCLVGGLLLLLTGAVIGLQDRLVNLFTDPGRIRLYTMAWDYIEAQPLSGSGIGMTAFELERVTGHDHYAAMQDSNQAHWSRLLFHPHNQNMTDWMQGGILLFAAWVLLIGTWGIIAWRRNDMFALTALVIFYITCNIDSPLLNTKGLYTLVWIIILMSYRPSGKKLPIDSE